MKELIIKPYHGNKKFKVELVKPFNYREIIVPKGFKSDGASVPWFFIRAFRRFDHYLECTCIHDFCYFKGLYSRRQADNLFLECMEDYNISKWKRALMWKAVRWFGWKPWNKQRKLEETE